MSKTTTLLVTLLSAGLLLTSCGKQDQNKLTASESSSLAATKKMSHYTLQQKFVAITDATMGPVQLVNKQSSSANAQLNTKISKATQKIQQIQTDLSRNQTNSALTNKLSHYAKTSLKLLNSITAANSNQYSENFTKLSNETQKIAKADFNNELPNSYQSVLTYQAEHGTYASGNILNTPDFRISFTKIQTMTTSSGDTVLLLTYTYHNKRDTTATPATDLAKYGSFHQGTTTLKSTTPTTSDSTLTQSLNQATQTVAAGKTVTAATAMTISSTDTAIEYNAVQPKNQKSLGTITINLKQS